MGIVWDLKEVPADVLEEGRHGAAAHPHSVKAE
jgi:hypothetical protein